jgi:hypothetical protein
MFHIVINLHVVTVVVTLDYVRKIAPVTYENLKDEALDFSLWETDFGIGNVPVERQIRQLS